MYAIKFYGGPNAFLIKATKFKVNKKETLVIFKNGIDSVGLFKMSAIQSITKVTEDKTREYYDHAESLRII